MKCDDGAWMLKLLNSVAGTGQTPVSLLKATQPGSQIKTGKISTINSMVREGLARDKWGRPVDGPVTQLITEGQGLGKKSIGKDCCRI